MTLDRRWWRSRPPLSSPVLKRVARRLDQVFDSLDDLKYLGEAEFRDYNYFRALFDESLAHIDRKAREGRLKPIDLRGFPRELRYPGLSARVGVFIGSFDPFQMTHLAMALRFLGSDECESDALFVVPEGSFNGNKPLKTEYDFRFDVLKRQISGIFEPLVVPLDIGEGADTIEIVRRLIGLHPGASLHLTHLMGSDSLPLAVSLLPVDLEAWKEKAKAHRVDLDLSVHIVLRNEDEDAKMPPLVQEMHRLGVRTVVDRTVIGTPSSTAFRSQGAITLVLPTEAILSRLEILFRYGMHNPWSV